MRGRLKGWARSVRRDAHAVYLAPVTRARAGREAFASGYFAVHNRREPRSTIPPELAP